MPAPVIRTIDKHAAHFRGRGLMDQRTPDDGASDEKRGRYVIQRRPPISSMAWLVAIGRGRSCTSRRVDARLSRVFPKKLTGKRSSWRRPPSKRQLRSVQRCDARGATLARALRTCPLCISSRVAVSARANVAESVRTRGREDSRTRSPLVPSTASTGKNAGRYVVYDLPTCWSIGYVNMARASTHQRLQRCAIGSLTSSLTTSPEKPHLCPRVIGQKRCAPRWLSLADECTAWSMEVRVYLISGTSGPIRRCCCGGSDNAVQ